MGGAPRHGECTHQLIAADHFYDVFIGSKHITRRESRLISNCAIHQAETAVRLILGRGGV
jgi:hypothetical protein